MYSFFRGEEIQKSKSGGGKDLEEFELYLPVHYRSIVVWHNQTVLPLGQKAKRYLEASSMVQNHTDHARLKGATLIKL